LKQLIDKGQFEKLRFWGKIFGTQKNYYVAEAEQNADEGEGDEDEGNEETNPNDDNKDTGDMDDMDGEEDPLPKSTYKPPAVVPKEERGTGVNKYTYYVCNHRMFIFVLK
jgi:radial spoke head protein 4A